MIIGLVCFCAMLATFYFLPRVCVALDMKQWAKDPSDRYGNLWHRQRSVIRGAVLLVASVVGHVFWLYHDLGLLGEGVMLSFFLGAAWFQYDFNTRLNMARMEKEPWITKWYVSTSATTSQFDQLLVAVASKISEETDTVLRRLLERVLTLAGTLYGLFFFVTLKHLI